MLSRLYCLVKQINMKVILVYKFTHFVMHININAFRNLRDHYYFNAHQDFITIFSICCNFAILYLEINLKVNI